MHAFTVLDIPFLQKRVKNNPDAAPNLLTQVEAYERNYFDVGELIEDSKTKAAALDTVADMETKMKEVSTTLLHCCQQTSPLV